MPRRPSSSSPGTAGERRRSECPALVGAPLCEVRGFAPRVDYAMAARAPTWSGRVTTRRRRTGPRRRSGGWLEDVRYQGRGVGRGFAVGCPSGRQRCTPSTRTPVYRGHQTRGLASSGQRGDFCLVPRWPIHNRSTGDLARKISDISGRGEPRLPSADGLTTSRPRAVQKSPRGAASRFHSHRRPAADKRRETWHVAVHVDGVADRELYARGGRCRPSAGVVAGLTACLVSHRASRGADPAALILPVFPCMVAA
jgi:hypothetical protein